MEVSREIILMGPQLLIFWSKNRKLLEIDSFLPPYTYLGSWQTTSFGEKNIRNSWRCSCFCCRFPYWTLKALKNMAATCFCCRFPCPYLDVLCAADASALIGRNLRIFWTLARWFTSFDGASLLLLTGFSVVILEGAVSSLGGFGSASDNRRGGKNSEWMYCDELHWIKQ